MFEDKFAEVMGKIYNNSMGINSLFISAGLPLEKLPIFGCMGIPYDYWREIFLLLWKNPKGRQDLLKILDAAIRFYPGNQSLPEIRKELSEKE